MKKALIFAALALVTAFSSANAFQNITPTDAYSMLASGQATLLDVRTPEEWAWVGHPGANKLGEGSAIADHVFNIAFEIEKLTIGFKSITQGVKNENRYCLNSGIGSHCAARAIAGGDGNPL